MFVLKLSLSLRVFLVSLCFSLSGCAYGILYTNTHEPIVTNMHDTPFSEVVAHGTSNEIKDPITAGGLKVQWASHAIGDAAKRAGLDEIYYADIHYISILGGLWKKNTINVYGRKPAL